jgi:hypothetical protein
MLGSCRTYVAVPNYLWTPLYDRMIEPVRQDLWKLWETFRRLSGCQPSLGVSPGLPAGTLHLIAFPDQLVFKSQLIVSVSTGIDDFSSSFFSRRKLTIGVTRLGEFSPIGRFLGQLPLGPLLLLHFFPLFFFNRPPVNWDYRHLLAHAISSDFTFA